MTSAATAVLHAIDAYQDTILAAERHIWNNPETGYREWKTHAYLKEQFEELGYTVTEAGNIPGFWSDIDTGRPGPCVAVFGEMDCLVVPSHPERDPETDYVHACGHNCQCAGLLGVAAGLKAPGALDSLSGRIRLIAVPAEEGIELSWRKQLMAQGIIHYIAGKQEFMYRGILDGVDMAMMVHTGGNGLSLNRGGNGCVVKEAVFTGRSAHAGGAPQLGLNALYAANGAILAANTLRETFKDNDHIRFHPIITQGGAAVNAIPDRVAVESYVRGASMEAIIRENGKINRAFAGMAAGMGCGLQLWDYHGYAPCLYDPAMGALLHEVGSELMGKEKMFFSDGWAMGCSDIGDVCCVMPTIQPSIAGCTGALHSKDFAITDPVTACVTSAKVQCALLVRLLENDAAEALRVLRENTRTFPTIPEYLAQTRQLCIDQSAVCHHEDQSITLNFGPPIPEDTEIPTPV